MEIRCTKGDVTWQAFEAFKEGQAGKFLFDREPLPPGIILGIENGERMWQAVLARCEELAPMGGPDGSSRSTAMFHGDGRGCSAVVKLYHRNGTNSVWHVEAHDMSGMRGPDVKVTVHGPWLDNQDAEWERRMAKDDKSKVVIAGHCWFTIGPGGSGGFGGHEFRFKALDGSGDEVVSRDMWFGGVIPPAWRGRIPDTHEMLEGFYPGPVE